MPQRSIAISAGALSPSTTIVSVVDCGVTGLSRVVTSHESAVGPRRQQWALASTYLGHDGTAGMERTAPRHVGWARQFTAQDHAPLGALRDGVCFRHRRHQCARIRMLGSREEDITRCLLNDAP